jgi:hypothetical protein
MMVLLGIFGSVGRTPPIQAVSNDVKVVGNKHGIANGWFNHPFDFDPTWLEECSGFEKKSRTGKGETNEGGNRG